MASFMGKLIFRWILIGCVSAYLLLGFWVAFEDYYRDGNGNLSCSKGGFAHDVGYECNFFEYVINSLSWAWLWIFWWWGLGFLIPAGIVFWAGLSLDKKRLLLKKWQK